MPNNDSKTLWFQLNATLCNCSSGSLPFLYMLRQALRCDVLQLSFNLEIRPGEVPHHQIIDGFVPHEIGMGAQILRLDASFDQSVEVRKSVDVLIGHKILAGDAHMAHRAHPAPGGDDALDSGIVRFHILALAHHPMMMEIEDERHSV